jgi:hypothetical protein
LVRRFRAGFPLPGERTRVAAHQSLRRLSPLVYSEHNPAA